MPRFAANLTTMFIEFEFPARFQAAAECGFKAVEVLSPYDYSTQQITDWLQDNELELLLINTPIGETMGCAALPGREQQFREEFELALKYAVDLHVPMIHLMVGRGDGDPDLLQQHLGWAADLAKPHDVTLNLEPLNHQDVPGYQYFQSADVIRLIDVLGKDNIKLQFDFYHLQITEGNLASNLERYLSDISHVQFSSLPGRHEPQYGEVNLPFLFDRLDQIGYSGWVGCEYKPKAGTKDGLSWGSDYGLS